MAEGFDNLPIGKIGRTAYRWRWVGFALWCGVTVCALAYLFLEMATDWQLWQPYARWLEAAYKRLGEPSGFRDAFDPHLSSRQVFWSTILLLVMMSLAWRQSKASLRHGKRGRAFNYWGGLMAALLITGAFWLSFGANDAYIECGKPISIISQVQTLRGQLELYQLQHNGQFPKLNQLWGNLLNKTDADGLVQPNGALGPYIQSTPINYHTGSSAIAADNSGAWQYDEKTGTLFAVLTPHDMGIRGFVTGDPDVVAAASDRLPEPRESVSWRRLRNLIDKAITGIAEIPGLVPTLIIGISWLVSAWAIKRLHRNRDQFYGAVTVAVLIMVLAAAGLAILPFGNRSEGSFTDWDFGQRHTAMICFGTAFWWAGSCLMAMQFQVIDHARRRAGHFCLKCGYNLRGSRVGVTNTCPECGKYAPTRTAA